MRSPKPRLSPRLSESAKRRRKEAVRARAGSGPGAAAMQALGLSPDGVAEDAANAAAAAEVAGELGEEEMQVEGGGGVEDVDSL